MTTTALITSLSHALNGILDFWADTVTDEEHGGFYGAVSNDNQPFPTADKSAVLNARILWTFSAAYNFTGREGDLKMAERAFNYFEKHFIDKENGGVYWSVNYLGQPAETRKQLYAIAFAIYACSEYYKAGKDNRALDLAIRLFHTIEQQGYDNKDDGYFEAFTADWRVPEDFRLSDKDANEQKTMNTHLHIVEAYTNLYTAWKSDYLAAQIRKLLHRFLQSIIDPDTGHLHLFFNEKWERRSDTISYGHDIEAAWLLLDSAKQINDPMLVAQYERLALKIADVTIREAVDKDGGLWYEYRPASRELVKEKHWWVQAEALVGFINAWQLQKDDKYWQAATDVWQFIDQYLADHERGEWYWGRCDDYTFIPEHKVGPWKCPYHNSRACINVMQRLA
ncbi:mannobiose 2-epimerase [Chitinophaga terrae (ex Kim and Jung 2007)]|uniref:Cellobiose 2-epimerase n=1 Tax=Chitinophaga terrae (ex Kim and Jung 2007) TaxID=408074 RepID=A0A1H3XBV2_9BACT|nr:AGE family epimerase/isomerase [Chitinophaga terrae (ex Kim and Jung 2007)]GEP89837.1 cellobiose 2-epimerase [Chitinophaga terrae (ex Kim and Jung 2007)]SDZ96154.1 mannobiose 2-epimerase [Chitinophaga terrae (ex Kim and Jung 2007)]